MSNPQSNSTHVPDPGQDWLQTVREHVESLRFGAVEIVVHEGRVIQIEKTERVRFEKGGIALPSAPKKAEPDTKTGGKN